jgi:hypothetical protein
VIAPGRTIAFPAPNQMRKSGPLEYGWLCSSCCRDLTIHSDAQQGVRIVERLESENGLDFGPAVHSVSNVET